MTLWGPKHPLKNGPFRNTGNLQEYAALNGIVTGNDCVKKGV